jgi:hypothetical protein
VPYNRHTNGRFLYRPVLDFRIILEARNPDRRCFRRYRMEAGTDLFRSWVVEISYGRIGTARRSQSFVVRDEGEARHLARSILKRRASAPRRIGVAYRIRELIIGRATPAVAAQVQNFYESVAQIFERWVTRRASTHTQRAYRQDVW